MGGVLTNDTDIARHAISPRWAQQGTIRSKASQSRRPQLQCCRSSCPPDDLTGAAGGARTYVCIYGREGHAAVVASDREHVWHCSGADERRIPCDTAARGIQPREISRGCPSCRRMQGSSRPGIHVAHWHHRASVKADFSKLRRRSADGGGCDPFLSVSANETSGKRCLSRELKVSSARRSRVPSRAGLTCAPFIYYNASTRGLLDEASATSSGRSTVSRDIRDPRACPRRCGCDVVLPAALIAIPTRTTAHYVDTNVKELNVV